MLKPAPPADRLGIDAAVARKTARTRAFEYPAMSSGMAALIPKSSQCRLSGISLISDGPTGPGYRPLICIRQAQSSVRHWVRSRHSVSNACDAPTNAVIRPLAAAIA